MKGFRQSQLRSPQRAPEPGYGKPSQELLDGLEKSDGSPLGIWDVVEMTIVLPRSG